MANIYISLLCNNVVNIIESIHFTVIARKGWVRSAALDINVADTPFHIHGDDIRHLSKQLWAQKRQ